jgi:general secretion pathway protein E
MRMGRSVEGVSRIFVPAGCPKCLGTGFQGRRGIYEMLLITDEMRDIILKSPSIQAIREATKLSSFSSLQQSGFKLVQDGVASMDEIERVTGTE